MERSGFTTIMLILTAVGMIAPAAEWIIPSTAPATTATDSAEVKPLRSANELRDAINARKTDIVDEPSVARPRGVANRDPFALPISPVVEGASEELLPTIELVGIIQTPDGGAATLLIDGTSVILRTGETVGKVTLRRLKLPDEAVISVNKATLIVKVL